MFKITRYFFVLFVLTTVLPLFGLFFFFHMQMHSMERQNSNHIISIGIKEVKDYIDETQKAQERIILEKLHSIQETKITEDIIRTNFSDVKLNFIYNNPPKEIEHYFENINGKLYIVNSVPISGSRIKAVEFASPANFSDAKIRGPFIAEVYIGNKITDKNLIYVFEDLHPNHFDKEMGPPPMSMGPERPPKDIFPPRDIHYGIEPPKPLNEDKISDYHIGIPKNKNINFSTIYLSDKSGKTVATLLIKASNRMPGPPPFFRNIFNILILFAGIIMSVIGAAFINKNYVLPLMTLSEAAKKVQDGELNVKIKANSNQEQIIKTFDYFNDMVEGLREKEELRKSFIASLTHDLRTPIVAQERSLGLIAETFKKMNLQDEYELAKTLEKNNQHLLRIVNIILESYKFERENIKLSFVNIKLSELLDDCFEKIKTIAEEKNITLINNIDKDFKQIQADKMSLERIFINLISNSIENIEKNKFVKISAKELDNKIKIEIEDNGPGIAASEINYIFETYYTGKGIDRKLGSGLGLDVCKKLVEMHNGTITVESEIGKFTKFTITLPS